MSEQLVIIFGDVGPDTVLGEELHRYRRDLQPVRWRLKNDRLEVVILANQTSSVMNKLMDLGFRNVLARNYRQ